MEIESPEVDPPMSLSALPEPMRRVLPSYIATGEGGLQAILNFRRVCRATKQWVDEVQEAQGKRMFSKATVRLEFGIEEIQTFLWAPPPFRVTSLTLLKLVHLAEHHFTPLEATMWNLFMSYWLPRLESLEIDVLQLPITPRLSQLLSAPSLRKLTFSSIRVATDDALVNPAEFPLDLLRLPELSIPKLKLKENHKRFFLTQLSTSQNLKRLVVRLEDVASLEGIQTIVENKIDDTDFHLYIVHDALLPTDLGYQYLPLVISVAASSSKIKILGVRERMIANLPQKVGTVVAGNFFKCVEMIRTMQDGVERLRNYPNLKILETFILTERNAGLLEFPQNLGRIRIDGDIPPPPNLPRRLTHLTLDGYTSTVNELLESLNSIAEWYPQLKQLRISWTSTGSHNIPLEASPKEPFNKFPNLRSLDFRGAYLKDDPINSNQVVLLEGFQLPHLTLHEFCFDANPRDGFWFPLKLDFETLGQMIEGPVGKTLFKVRISDLSVTKEARPLLFALESNAAVIRDTRKETHGRKLI